MRSFVLRARSASAVAGALCRGRGSEAHTEHIAHVLLSALFVSRGHRADSRLFVVLDRGSGGPASLCVSGEELGSLGGLDECSLLGALDRALAVAGPAAAGWRREATTGVAVRRVGFEVLVKELSAGHALYSLERRGRAVGEQRLRANPCFVLSDHVPMPRKSLGWLQRLGAERLSLGPSMLLASQCVTLLHHYCDLDGV